MSIDTLKRDHLLTNRLIFIEELFFSFVSFLNLNQFYEFSIISCSGSDKKLLIFEI